MNSYLEIVKECLEENKKVKQNKTSIYVQGYRKISVKSFEVKYYLY